MGQYNLMFEQEEFTELVRLYSELAKIADRQMNEYQMILDIINTNSLSFFDISLKDSPSIL